MFDFIKNSLNFGIIKKAISDEKGNINIKTERYYNTLMLTYLQAKNELIYQKTGINLVDIHDIEVAYGWCEVFCRTFFMGVIITDKDLCPWCMMYSCGSSPCTYGERHGFCISNCNKNNVVQTDKSTYSKIIEVTKMPIMSIPGISHLYSFYANLVLTKFCKMEGLKKM